MFTNNMFNNSAFGLNSWTTNTVANNRGASTYYSQHNNGFTRMGFRVQSSAPSMDLFTNLQARPFSNYAFIPILNFTGQNGLVNLPPSFQTIYPDMIPTMSYLTNWGGNFPM